MKIVSGEHVARFVSERLDVAFCPPYAAIGIERGDEVVAGVILNVFENEDIHVSVAGSGWTRRFLEEIGDYVFRQIGCNRATIITESERVAAMAQKLGGCVEGTLREHFGFGRDAIVIGILAREYRYAKVKLH